MNGRRVYHARGKVLGGSSQHQRDDLPARQPARLRALGRRPGHGDVGLRPLPAVLQADGELPAPAPTSSGAATRARWCSSAARRRTRSSRRSSRPCSRPATRSPTTSTATGRRASRAFDRNIHRGRRLSAARAYLHPVMDRPNLEVRTPRARHQGALRGHARRSASRSRGQGARPRSGSTPAR